MAITPAVHFYLSGKQREAVGTVDEDFRMSRDGKVDYMRKTIAWIRHYNQYIPRPKTKEGVRRARLANPQGFSVVEHATAKMKAAIYPSNPNNPIARALPVEEGDVEGVESVELLSNYHQRKAKMRYKGEKWIRNYNLFGVAPLLCFWNRQIAYNKQIRMPIEILNPMSGRIERIGLSEPVASPAPFTVHNHPDAKIIHVEDFYPDPYAQEFDGDCMRFCIVIMYYPYYYLKALVESNPDMYDANVFNMIPKDDSPPLRANDPFASEITRYHWTPSNLDMHSGTKGILECKFWMNKDRFIMVVNDQYPIMDIENPYWDMDIPLLIPTRLPLANYPWGKGHIEPLDNTLKYMNALRNSNLDWINLILNPPWLTLQGAVDPRKLLNLYPNKVIELPDLTAAKHMEFPTVTGAWVSEDARMKEDIEQISSLVGIATGQNPPNVRTGTQALSLLEIAAERIQMDIDGFIEQGQAALHRKFHMLAQMFMTEPEKVRIIGEEEEVNFRWVHPHEIIGEYDFIIESGARTTPKAVEAQQRIMGINNLLPVLQAFPDRLLKLYAIAYRNMGWFNEAKELNHIAKELAAIRMVQGGMIQQGGQGTQGAYGAAGANSAPENTPAEMEDVINQATNQAGGMNTPELQ